MADLLECLVQIRALREGPRRVAELRARAAPEAWAARPAADVWSPVEILAHLADAELFFGVRLRLMLTCLRPPLQPYDQEALAARAGYSSWAPDLALGRYRARRGETLELLDSCTAAELERSGVHPRRGSMTVADLVAVMLAHDTAHIGQIRERLAHSLPEGED